MKWLAALRKMMSLYHILRMAITTILGMKKKKNIRSTAESIKI